MDLNNKNNIIIREPQYKIFLMKYVRNGKIIKNVKYLVFNISIECVYFEKKITNYIFLENLSD